MDSTERRPRDRTLPATPAGPSLGALQTLFIDRLRDERMHLVRLSAALALAEEDPRRIFDDLNFRAHRLKGAAATFGFQALADGAGMLERAAFAAVSANAAHGDAAVWNALIMLVQMLGATWVAAAERAAEGAFATP